MKTLRHLAALTLLSTGLVVPALAADKVYVATTAIVEHPALDAVRDGVKDVLAQNGYDGDKLKFTYESAQGRPDLAVGIARRLVGEKPDVIVAISTPSAQSVASATRTIPVVFSAVTDPLAAKLVADAKKPGGNVTGVSDLLPVGQHLDMIRSIMPDLKSIGVPYNPGEVNAATLVEMIKAEAKKRDITVVTAAAPRSSDVQAAAFSLVGKADAIYTITDNTVVTAFEAMMKVSRDKKIPIFGAESSMAERGAVAAFGVDYRDVGRQTGDMVLRILKGEKPGDIPVTYARNTKSWINPKMAQYFGLTFPAAMAADATRVGE